MSTPTESSGHKLAKSYLFDPLRSSKCFNLSTCIHVLVLNYTSVFFWL